MLFSKEKGFLVGGFVKILLGATFRHPATLTVQFVNSVAIATYEKE
jgi:hypothetical protein